MWFLYRLAVSCGRFLLLPGFIIVDKNHFQNAVFIVRSMERGIFKEIKAWSSLPLFLSLSLSLCLSLSVSLCLSHTHSLSPSLSLSLSFSNTFSFSLSLSHTFSFSFFLSLTLSFIQFCVYCSHANFTLSQTDLLWMGPFRAVRKDWAQSQSLWDFKMTNSFLAKFVIIR